jgi:hypothetical protein
MPTLEQCIDRNERLHSAIIPDRGLFASEPRAVSFRRLLCEKAA